MLVKDVMTKNVVTCTTDDNISTALGKMQKHKIHQLPVIEKKSLKGILTLNRVITSEADPYTTKVSNVMISTPTVEPDENIEKIIAPALLKEDLLDQKRID